MFTLQSTLQRQRICLMNVCSLPSTLQRQRMCLIHVGSLYSQHCNDNACVWYMNAHFTANMSTMVVWCKVFCGLILSWSNVVDSMVTAIQESSSKAFMSKKSSCKHDQGHFKQPKTWWKRCSFKWVTITHIYLFETIHLHIFNTHLVPHNCDSIG